MLWEKEMMGMEFLGNINGGVEFCVFIKLCIKRLVTDAGSYTLWSFVK